MKVAASKVSVYYGYNYVMLLFDQLEQPSLISRPLPDFSWRLWRKIRRRPGIIAMSQTGNGGHG